MTTNAKKRKLIPVSIFAKKIGISRQRLYKLITNKTIKAVIKDGMFLIDEKEARRFRTVNIRGKSWKMIK